MLFYKITVYLVLASPIAPLMVYLKQFRKLPSFYHFIGAVLLISLTVEVSAFILIKLGYHTILLNNSYDICAFLLTSIFYYYLLFAVRLRWVLVLGSLIYAIAVTWSVYSIGVNSAHMAVWSINSAITGIYGMLYFVLLPSMIIERLLDKNLYSHVVINSSLLFYYLVTVLFFVWSTYFFNDGNADANRLLWSFHNIANIIKNFGLAIGLYYTGRRDVKTTLLEIERIGRERSGEPRDPLWTNSLKK